MIDRLATSRDGLKVRAIGLLLALGLAAGPALAREPRHETSAGPATSGVRLRLDDARLMPRVSVAMESLTTFHNGAQPGGSLQDHVMFSEMSESVRNSAKSVTRKAIRNYLFDSINLDRGIDRVRSSVRGSGGAPAGVRFRLGFHSAVPRIGIQKSVGQSSLRLRAGADGHFAIGLKNYRFERAEVSVIFDGDDTVTLYSHLGF